MSILRPISCFSLPVMSAKLFSKISSSSFGHQMWEVVPLNIVLDCVSKLEVLRGGGEGGRYIVAPWVNNMISERQGTTMCLEIWCSLPLKWFSCQETTSSVPFPCFSKSISLFFQKYFSFFQKYFSFFSKVFLFFGKIFSERVKAGGRLVVFDYDLKYKLKNSHN